MFLSLLFFGGNKMVDKKEILINGRLYEVVDADKYVNNEDVYLQGYTAISDGLGHVYPVVPFTSNEPGVKYRKRAPVFFANVPTESESDYSADRIIDYSKANTYKEFVETQNMVKELEKDILTSPDNIYIPPESTNDSPAMKALKEAVVDKRIDLDKYEPRFGSNYNNDKRIFNKQNISLPMLVRMCNALDIKATLILENQSAEVPNPMSEPITVEITSANNSNDEEE